MVTEVLRAYFRKIKPLGIGRVVRKCSFWKNTFSFKSKVSKTTSGCQKQLRSSRSLLDYPSTFPSNNVTLFIETKSPFPRAISFNSFILSKYVLYFSYFWSILSHIFFQRTKHNGVYAVKCESWLWKQAKNKYAVSWDNVSCEIPD